MVWRPWELPGLRAHVQGVTDQRKTPEGQAYNRVAPRTRALVALTYLSLAALLAVGVAETYVERSL